MSERQGIEIDYCPNCRGIWLDRGELDKIIEKANISDRNASAQFQPQSSYKESRYHDDYRKYHKKHWLSELFD